MCSSVAVDGSLVVVVSSCPIIITVSPGKSARENNNVPGVSAVACPSSRVSCPGVEILGNETWWQVPVARDLFVTVTVTASTQQFRERHCGVRTYVLTAG